MNRLFLALALTALPHTQAFSALPDVAAAGREVGIIKVVANGLSFGVRVVGPANGRPLVLVAGTGMQLIEWPPELIDGLVGQGYRVITYDHRDAGASTHFTQAGPPDWPAILAALRAGNKSPLPYAADDMAQDLVALLDALRLKKVDLLGVSGGATIAALAAAAHPDKIRALTLIAANSGNPAIPTPADPARLAAVPLPAAGDDHPAAVSKRLAMHRALAGRGSTVDEARLRSTIEQAVSREHDPLGYARQGAALVALGDVRTRLRAIKAPTVVIHGEEDPLISSKAGQEVAESISNATYLAIDGMGHELAPERIPAILDAVQTNAFRAR